MQKTKEIRDTITVAKFTMLELIKRKSFRVSVLIVLALIVIGFNIPNIVTALGNDHADKILVSDPEDVFEGSLSVLSEEMPYEFVFEDFEFEQLRQKVADEEVSAAILLEKSKGEDSKGEENPIKIRYLVKSLAVAQSLPQDINDALNRLYQTIQLSKLDLSEKQLQALTSGLEVSLEQADDQEVNGNIFVSMILSAILFFAIYFCAYQVSSSITIEKTSKIIETLVTSTSPRSIIIGKTIGIGLVGLGQIILFAFTAIVCAHCFLDRELLASLVDLSSLTPDLGLIMIVYFILGYTTYALLYALTGSTVSKPEEIQAANTPVVILTMISFYLAYFTLADPSSSLNLFAALFPFSAPFCMPLRVMMGVASGWEVLASVLILFVASIIIARVAIRIYSNAILNYGGKMNLKTILRHYRDE